MPIATDDIETISDPIEVVFDETLQIYRPLTSEQRRKLRLRAENLVCLVHHIDDEDMPDGALFQEGKLWADVCSPLVILALLDELEFSER